MPSWSSEKDLMEAFNFLQEQGKFMFCLMANHFVLYTICCLPMHWVCQECS